MSRRLLSDAEIVDPLTTACGTLEKGRQGPDQPPTVRRHLRALEQAGLASYDAKRGWRLTDRGEAVSAALLRTAKHRRRQGAKSGTRLDSRPTDEVE